MKPLLALALVAFVMPVPAQSADPAPAITAAPAKTAAPPDPWYDWAMTPWGPMLQQTGPVPPWRNYQMNRVLTPAEKQRMMEMAMPMLGNMMKLDAREAMNWFAAKVQARPGVSFDDAVESLKLAANTHNLKFVGSNLLWKDFQAVLGDKSAPRVEVFSFCDIAVARELLKYIPEMVVFLPCRIAVMEDADKNVWLLTLDWDMTWLDLAGKQAGMTPELRQGVQTIRAKMEDVMRAAADGTL